MNRMHPHDLRAIMAAIIHGPIQEGTSVVVEATDHLLGHPLLHPDADVGCRWLCETAGRRTPGDERILASVTRTLPFEGRPFPPSYFPNPSAILERVQ